MAKAQTPGFRVVSGGGLESKDAGTNEDTSPTQDADDSNKVVALREVKGLIDGGRKDIAALLAKHKAAADEEKTALRESIDAALSRLEDSEVKFAELRAELDEQTLQNQRAGVHGTKSRIATLGDMFCGSDEYKSFQGSSLKSSAPFRIEGGFMGRKADAILTEGSATSGSALTEPWLISQPFRAPVRPLVLRDLLPRNTITTNALEYIEQTNFNYLYAEVRTTTGIGAVTVQLKTSGTDGSEFAGSHGFYAGQTVVFEKDVVGQEETLVISSVDLDAGTFDVTTTIDHPAASAVTADDYTYTSETILKPRARATFDRVTETVKTLATSIPITRQMSRDAGLLSTMLNNQLIESLRLTEEQQILYGDGTTDQLTGFFNHGSVQTYAWSSGVTGDTKIDCIRKAMTLAQLAHFPVGAILVHPTDWQDIELTKDGASNTGAYILPNVPTSAAQPMLFRVPVIPTTALQPNDCLLGAFDIGCALWDREEANIRIADQHEDFFAKNMELILAEERMLFAVYYPESFVAIDFDAAP